MLLLLNKKHEFESKSTIEKDQVYGYKVAKHFMQNFGFDPRLPSWTVLLVILFSVVVRDLQHPVHVCGGGDPSLQVPEHQLLHHPLSSSLLAEQMTQLTYTKVPRPMQTGDRHMERHYFNHFFVSSENKSTRFPCVLHSSYIFLLVIIIFTCMYLVHMRYVFIQNGGWRMIDHITANEQVIQEQNK